MSLDLFMSEGDQIDSCACGIDTDFSASNISSSKIYTLREVELLPNGINLTYL
jgi:hypothetical protein